MRIAIVMTCFAAASAAFADESLYGPYVTGDGVSVVALQPCAQNPLESCGYLIGFVPSGHETSDRAMCGFRIFGGLKSQSDGFKDGWIMALEDDDVYKLKIQKGRVAGEIKLSVYQKFVALSETLIWKRYGAPNQTKDQTQDSANKFSLCQTRQAILDHE